MRQNQVREVKRDPAWDRKTIRRNSRRMVFGNGWRFWLILVGICFVFSFLGGGSNIGSVLLSAVDRLLGLSPENSTSNVELLETYVLSEAWVQKNPFFSAEFVRDLIDLLSRDFAWLVNLLAANAAYFARNAGEVFAYLLLAAAINAVIRFFAQYVLIIGRNRFFLEARVQNHPHFRRAFAPFHRRYLLNILRGLLCYHLLLFLWNLTIIGGVYKHYQYRMIPYLLAENPEIRFRDALALSKQMTDGYKWQMFVLDCSLWYVAVIKLIPVAGLLVALPYEAAVEAEVYGFLRAYHRPAGAEALFCEEAFDHPVWWEPDAQEAPAFHLTDLVVEDEKPEEHTYGLIDYVLLFFLFCLVGWIWEEVLHWVQTHTIVNRGTMYGPWLPIYGFGGVLCIFFLDRYKKHFAKTFALIMLMTGVLEFLTSWALEFFFQASYWEYHNMFANLNGRICLAGLVAFGLGGSFAIYIAGPYFQKKFAGMQRRTRVILCAVLCALFAADLLCCAIFGFNSGAGVGEKLV